MTRAERKRIIILSLAEGKHKFMVYFSSVSRVIAEENHGNGFCMQRLGYAF